MFKKTNRLLSILLIMVMILTTLPINPVYGAVDDNIGGGDAGGGTGSGSDSWKYTSSNSGVRVTFYWAEGSPSILI
jgi:hypothetical protein